MQNERLSNDDFIAILAKSRQAITQSGLLLKKHEVIMNRADLAMTRFNNLKAKIRNVD